MTIRAVLPNDLSIIFFPIRLYSCMNVMGHHNSIYTYTTHLAWVPYARPKYSYIRISNVITQIYIHGINDGMHYSWEPLKMKFSSLNSEFSNIYSHNSNTEFHLTFTYTNIDIYCTAANMCVTSINPLESQSVYFILQ